MTLPVKPKNDHHLTIRLTEVAHKEFSVKAKAYGGPSFVLRELIAAFNQNRLVIQPPVNQPAEGLYK